MIITNYIKRQLMTPGGYLEFLKIAIPLVISTGIGAIQLFINRTFLSWYSTTSFAASVPAGISCFAIFSLFLGTLAYVDVFVAQYYGKGEYRSIGPAVWQSVYLAFGAALIMLFISFFSDAIFNAAAHGKEIAIEEAKFFRIMCYGALPALSGAALSGFYAGRGKTKVVLFVSMIGVFANIILDFILIFGKFGFPELGISGAALASNLSFLITLIIYIILIISKKNNNLYNTRCVKVDFSFMKKLLKFGFPNGVQFFFDMAGFGIFVLIIGRLGIEALSASNIALNVNHLVFMPLIGCGIATSVMVGKYLGQNKYSLAKASVRSASQIIYFYAFCVILTLIVFPEYTIYPFSGGAESAIIENIKPTVIILLRILAAYFFFDCANIIFSAAIKGAGDTVFVMKTMIIASITLVIIPTYLVVIVFNLGLYTAWYFMVIYIMVLGCCFYIRYKSNKWKSMRVIKMDVIDG
ncbi:MAG: MATE family efflux transporter [Elusimicrobiota bacterium]|jgi:MATE family multidrug resistance protein|nr:MATE family efflux transporter [Elusimicrobiota bacterium]